MGTHILNPLKIMSFNLRYGTAPDGENGWYKRKPLALERIQAFAPDLLGLQECRDDEQAEFIKTNLPEYEFYGVRREGGKETALEMAPVLFRRAAFEELERGHFWLSETPEMVGSKSWNSTFARTATWVKLRHTATGHSLIFLNTHFDYHPPAVDGAARLLRGWLARQTAPLIVTGDFNAEKNSAAYQLLAGGGALADAYRQVWPNGNAQEATFHGYGQTPELTIDWILISPHFQVMSASVDRTHAGNLFPSDHYPVLAELAWQ
jgi:endonuclease/exonuclease/phosphatase family metal-dependent hydrolase